MNNKLVKESPRKQAIRAIDQAIRELRAQKKMLIKIRSESGLGPRGWIINPKTGKLDWYLDPGDPRLAGKREQQIMRRESDAAGA